MALIWMDGFDHYGTDTSRMTEGSYDQVDSAFTLSEVNPRTGTRCLRRSSSAVDNRVLKNWGSIKPTVGVGAAFNLSSLPSSDYAYALISLVDSNESDQVTIAVNEDGSIRALLGGVTGEEIASSDPGVVSSGVYTHIEFGVTEGVISEGITTEIATTLENFDGGLTGYIISGPSDRFDIIADDFGNALKVSAPATTSATNVKKTITSTDVSSFSIRFKIESLSTDKISDFRMHIEDTSLALFVFEPKTDEDNVILQGRPTLRNVGIVNNNIFLSDGVLTVGIWYELKVFFVASSVTAELYEQSSGDLIGSGSSTTTGPPSLVDKILFLAENNDPGSDTGAIVWDELSTLEEVSSSGSSDGILEVRVDGATVLSRSDLVTVLSEELGYSGITINCGSAVAHGVTTDVDDWYIWDDQGAWNNSFLGDRRCLLMKPNQDTNIADFDPSSGSFGYKMIDDDSPDDDSTYIIAEAYLQSGSPLTGTSEFEIENLPDGTSLISAVKVVTRASKTDSTSAEVFTSINSGVNSLSQSAHVLTTSYQYYSDLYEYDPTTIANITRDGFNSFSVSVTADDLDPGAVSPGEESPGPGSPGGSPTEPGLWTPALITTAAWYDFSDSATITTISGFISQATDKSGNTRTASQSTASQRPALISASQNGLDVARFDGVNDNLTCINTNNIAQNVGAISIFAVYNRTGGDAIGTLYNVSTGLDAGNFRSMLGYDTTSGAPWSGGRRLDSDSAQAHNAAAASGWLLGSTEFDYSNAELYLSSNGTRSARGGFQTAGNTSNTLSVANAIGRNANAAANANKLGGDVGEIIVLQSVPTTDDRQRIEGYLAHKWGLEGSLPVSHPYKSSPPTA